MLINGSPKLVKEDINGDTEQVYDDDDDVEQVTTKNVID